MINIKLLKSSHILCCIFLRPTAQGNVSDKPWVLFPGEDGTPHVAFLRGGLNMVQHFHEPYGEGIITFQFYSKLVITSSF
jgi:hypothetical protein